MIAKERVQEASTWVPGCGWRRRLHSCRIFREHRPYRLDQLDFLVGSVSPNGLLHETQILMAWEADTQSTTKRSAGTTAGEKSHRYYCPDGPYTASPTPPWRPERATQQQAERVRVLRGRQTRNSVVEEEAKHASAPDRQEAQAQISNVLDRKYDRGKRVNFRLKKHKSH